MSTKIRKEDFNLKKFKLKDLGVSLEYRRAFVHSNESEYETIKSSKSIARHPIVDELCNKLRVHFAVILGMLPEMYVDADLEKMTEDERVEYNAVVNCIFITGISFVGSDDRKGYVITATKEIFPGRKIGITTPVVYEDDKDYITGCALLSEICDSIEEEIFEYAINNKSAQLDLFNGYGAASDSEEEDGEDSEDKEVGEGASETN